MAGGNQIRRENGLSGVYDQSLGSLQGLVREKSTRSLRGEYEAYEESMKGLCGVYEANSTSLRKT